MGSFVFNLLFSLSLMTKVLVIRDNSSQFKFFSTLNHEKRESCLYSKESVNVKQ